MKSGVVCLVTELLERFGFAGYFVHQSFNRKYTLHYVHEYTYTFPLLFYCSIVERKKMVINNVGVRVLK